MEKEETLNRLIDSMMNRIFRYENYYQILGVSKNNITDEIVLEKYENKKTQLEKFFSELEVIKGDELKKKCETLKEKMEVTIEDAFYALKTKESRRNYEEKILNNIENKNEKGRDI